MEGIAILDQRTGIRNPVKPCLHGYFSFGAKFFFHIEREPDISASTVTCLDLRFETVFSHGSPPPNQTEQCRFYKALPGLDNNAENWSVAWTRLLNLESR
jgi:hypothetical protein